MTGTKAFGVLQTVDNLAIRAHSCSDGWSTTFSPQKVPIVRGKTYWVNLHLDGINGKCYVAVFDPDDGFNQVGVTCIAESTAGNQISTNYFHFGRCSSHGDSPNNDTNGYVSHILIDYTNAAFPLLPDGTSDDTPPANISSVNDGTGSDIDTTYSTSQLSANWSSSSDSESGISSYKYAIGTTAGGTDVVGWTDNSGFTSVTETRLSLTVGMRYYFTVKAVNGIGLESIPTNSDGILITSSPPIIPPRQELDLKVYPHPYIFTEHNSMTFSMNGTTGGTVGIYTISGKLVKKLQIGAGTSEVNWDVVNEEGNRIKNGIYIYIINGTEGNRKAGKLVISE
jgi:hypothetical protein